MDYIDLTLLLDDSYLEYPGDIPFSTAYELTYLEDKTNIQRINTNMHIGTHIDAPNHALEEGLTIDKLDINKLVGNALVIDPLLNDNIINTDSIINQYDDARILLIRTNHSKLVNTPAYYSNYPKFERRFIDFIKSSKVEVLAFDFPSPNYFDETHMELHIDLFNEDIILVENLINLDKLNKHIHFIALPLKIKGFDGSLTRCIARNLSKFN